MKCAYCGKDILPGTGISSADNVFCDSLHRKLWQDYGPAGNSPATRPLARGKVKRGKLGIVIALLIGLFVGMGIGFGAGIYESGVVKEFVGPGGSVNPVLKKVADEVNSSCPVMVDRDTRLDNAVAGSGETLYYNYTLIHAIPKNLDIMKAKSILKPRIVNNVRTSKELEILRSMGVTFVYKYSDDSGNVLFEIHVRPADYK